MLEFAILGLLHEAPMHGYVLRKRLHDTLGMFRAFSYGSLYPTLRRLQRAGFIVEEADEVAGEVDDKAVLDAALINAGQAAEHYEITRYGSLIAWAKQLGRSDCAAVLAKTLEEEKATDKKLTTLAESKVNMRAAS